jgi:hypothetical protein
MSDRSKKNRRLEKAEQDARRELEKATERGGHLA